MLDTKTIIEGLRVWGVDKKLIYSTIDKLNYIEKEMNISPQTIDFFNRYEILPLIVLLALKMCNTNIYLSEGILRSLNRLPSFKGFEQINNLKVNNFETKKYFPECEIITEMEFRRYKGTHNFNNTNLIII